MRDEAGRIVAASGGEIAPLPLAIGSQRRLYEEGSGDSHVIGAAIEAVSGQTHFTAQVEEIASRLPSISTAVFNEFVADGGWFIIVFLLVQLGISVATVRRRAPPLEELSALAGKINPGSSSIRLPQSGVPREILAVGRGRQLGARPA